MVVLTGGRRSRAPLIATGRLTATGTSGTSPYMRSRRAAEEALARVDELAGKSKRLADGNRTSREIRANSRSFEATGSTPCRASHINCQRPRAFSSCGGCWALMGRPA
jgi:hypothetical protein